MKMGDAFQVGKLDRVRKPQGGASGQVSSVAVLKKDPQTSRQGWEFLYPGEVVMWLGDHEPTTGDGRLLIGGEDARWARMLYKDNVWYIPLYASSNLSKLERVVK